jgi:hypothetical protein
MAKEEGNLFSGDIALSTPYGVVYIRNKGREITFKLHDSISQNIHNKVLFNYVAELHRQGIADINCDHVYFDYLKRGISLKRSSRILDIVYFKKGEIYECEVKTTREIWLEHTAQQLKDFEKTCQNLIMLVPRSEMETTRQLLQSLKLFKTKVDTYEL